VRLGVFFFQKSLKLPGCQSVKVIVAVWGYSVSIAVRVKYHSMYLNQNLMEPNLVVMIVISLTLFAHLM